MKRYLRIPRVGGSILRVVMLMTMLSGFVHAEVIEMINGDRYRGTLVSVNRTTVFFKSEIQDDVKLPRAKVAAIYFKDPAPVSKAATGSLLNQAAQPKGTPNELLKLIQKQGVDPSVVSQIQQQILGDNPEGQAVFNELLGGFMGGTLSIKDLQGQAKQAAQDLRSVRSELGDDAGPLLDGYLKILENFVNQAEE